jgi:hypothetical protein
VRIWASAVPPRALGGEGGGDKAEREVGERGEGGGEKAESPNGICAARAEKALLPPGFGFRVRRPDLSGSGLRIWRAGTSPVGPQEAPILNSFR